MTTLPGPLPLIWKVITGAGKLFGYRKKCGWLMIKPNRKDLEFVNGLIEEDKLRANVEHTYTFDEIREASEQIETGHTHGKIVIRIA